MGDELKDAAFLDKLEFIGYEVSPDWRRHTRQRLRLSLFGGSVVVIGAISGAVWSSRFDHPLLEVSSEVLTLAVFWPVLLTDGVWPAGHVVFGFPPLGLAAALSPFISICACASLIYAVLSRLAKRPYR